MYTSAAGRAAIMQREGCELKAYRDSVGVWTIGCGHTGRASPPMVTPGMTITRAQADAMLANDLVEFERAVNATIVQPISQNAFDALVSFAFNVGADTYHRSSVALAIRNGDLKTAGAALLLYDKAGGKFLQGLANRRKAERDQLLRPDGQAQPAKKLTAKAGAAAAGAVVVAAGTTAAASGGSGWAISIAILAALALAVFLILHLRKKA